MLTPSGRNEVFSIVAVTIGVALKLWRHCERETFLIHKDSMRMIGRTGGR